MNILFKKNVCGAGYSYLQGQNLNCDNTFGQNMIDLGFADKIADSSDGQTINPSNLNKWKTDENKRING